MATAFPFTSSELAFPSPDSGVAGREFGLPIRSVHNVKSWPKVTTLSGKNYLEDIRLGCKFFYNLKDITFSGYFNDPDNIGGHANVPMFTFGNAAFHADRNQPVERAFQGIAKIGDSLFNPINYNNTGTATEGTSPVKIRWFPQFSAYYDGPIIRGNLIGYGLPPLKNTEDADGFLIPRSSNFHLGHNFFGLGPTTACTISFVGGYDAIASSTTNNVISTALIKLGGVRCTVVAHANCNRGLSGAEGTSSSGSLIATNNFVDFAASGTAQTFDEPPEDFETSGSGLTFNGLQMHTYIS
jgi:hypothetical protein